MIKDLMIIIASFVQIAAMITRLALLLCVVAYFTFGVDWFAPNTMLAWYLVLDVTIDCAALLIRRLKEVSK